jgi:hypothetical protein
MLLLALLAQSQPTQVVRERKSKEIYLCTRANTQTLAILPLGARTIVSPKTGHHAPILVRQDILTQA